MKHYTAPAVVDFGTVESLTTGNPCVGITDFPLGGPPCGFPPSPE